MSGAGSSVPVLDCLALPQHDNVPRDSEQAADSCDGAGEVTQPMPEPPATQYGDDARTLTLGAGDNLCDLHDHIPLSRLAEPTNNRSKDGRRGGESEERQDNVVVPRFDLLGDFGDVPVARTAIESADERLDVNEGNVGAGRQHEQRPAPPPNAVSHFGLHDGRESLLARNLGA